MWLDSTLNGIDYTYHNDNLGNFSLIDNFVCSPKLVGSSIHNQILNHGDNISDHLAIMCNFKPNETVLALKMNEYVLSKLCGTRLIWDFTRLFCVMHWQVLAIFLMRYCVNRSAVRDTALS